MAAQDNVCVIADAQIIHGNSKIVQVFVKQLPESDIAGFHLGEKIFQVAVCEIGQSFCGAIGIQTSVITAVAFPAVRNNTHMAELTGPPVVAVIDGSGLHQGAAHAVAEKQVNYWGIGVGKPAFCQSG